MNITELNGTELNGAAGGQPLPATLGLYAKVARAASGIALVGAEVTVLNSKGEPAELYSASLGNAPELLEQPLLTDNTGAFSFYAPFGTYTVTVTSGGEVKTLNNQNISPDRAYIDSLRDYADEQVAKAAPAPIGTISRFPRQSGDIPDNWIQTGVAAAQAEYPALFKLAGLAQLPRPPETKSLLLGQNQIPSDLTVDLSLAPYIRGQRLIVLSDSIGVDNKLFAAYELDHQLGKIFARPNAGPAIFSTSTIDDAELNNDLNDVTLNYAQGDGDLAVYIVQGLETIGGPDFDVSFARWQASGYVKESPAFVNEGVDAFAFSYNAKQLDYRSRGGIGALVATSRLPGEDGGVVQVGKIDETQTPAIFLETDAESLPNFENYNRVLARVLSNGDDVAAFLMQENVLTAWILQFGNVARDGGVQFSNPLDFNSGQQTATDNYGRFTFGTYFDAATNELSFVLVELVSTFGDYSFQEADRKTIFADTGSLDSPARRLYMSPDGKRCRAVLDPYLMSNDSANVTFDFEIIDGKLVPVESRPLPSQTNPAADRLDAYPITDVLVPVEIRADSEKYMAATVPFEPLGAGEFRTPDATDVSGFVATYIKAK